PAVLFLSNNSRTAFGLQCCAPLRPGSSWGAISRSQPGEGSSLRSRCLAVAAAALVGLLIGAPTSGARTTLTRFILSVHGHGHGHGNVDGDVSCSADQRCDFLASDGATINLQAHADDDWVFDGWKGACSGKGSCSATAHGSLTSVGAYFVEKKQPLSVSV